MRIGFASLTLGILVACGGSGGDTTGTGGSGAGTGGAGVGAGEVGGSGASSETGGGGAGTGAGGSGGGTPSGSFTLVGVGTWGLRGITEDGSAFTVCQNPPQGSDHTPDLLRNVAYGHGVFVAVGGDANSMVMRSFDGLHWEEDLHPVTNCEGESYPPSCKNWMGGVAYGDGLWLAGGGNGALMRSVDDGVTWTGLHPSPGLSAVRSIAFGGGVFVAGTDGGVLSVSSDGGDSWTHHDLWDYDFQVAAGGGAFVAQGRHWNGSGFDYGCAVSVDAGASWSSCDPALLTAGPAAYGDGRWVAQTSGGYLESSDATTWTMVSAMDFPDQPVWTGEGWIGIRGGNAVTSQNLVDWQVGAGNVPGFRAITGGLVLDDNLPVENVPLCQDNG